MQFANLIWEKNTPYSTDFNDIYFNNENGISESEYVFITQNRLQERFASPKNNTFTIIETGFGAGLNFFSAASLWLATSPKNAALHYISVEKYPLKIQDMQKMIGFLPDFLKISAEFLSNYQDIKPHCNTFHLAESRIQLDLCVDDVVDGLSQINQKADVWFLDGFAPAKNAEMWSDGVFQQIAHHSNVGSTFATFTSAGLVRRGLQAVGFDVQKQPGFGKKREMLSGVYKP